MSARHRPMRPADLRPALAMLAAHPVLGPRYGDAIECLLPAWRGLLGGAATHAQVFEDVDGTGARIWGAGVSVFVSDEFLRELKTPPFFWIGPELARRVSRGMSPVLSDEQLREANSRGGLNLVVWEACVRWEDLQRVEATSLVMAAFLEQHRGYLIREAVAAQAWALEHLRFLLNTGSLLLDPASGRYAEPAHRNLEEVARHPHVVGLTRELALRQHGGWAANLFVYHPPRFGFRPAEQRLLLAAQDGPTDAELSDQLGISVFTVKKTWREIYDRVAASLPELIPPHADREDGATERGREKKQRLLAYLREHPEELRPFARKLLPSRSVRPGPAPGEP